MTEWMEYAHNMDSQKNEMNMNSPHHLFSEMSVEPHSKTNEHKA
jgi:hypothetical protein